MNFKQLLPCVKAMLFDVDGVLSSAAIPLYPGGEPMRVINTKDGYALHQASQRGFLLAVVTGGNTQAIFERFCNLGFQEIRMNAHRKLGIVKEILEKYGIAPENTLFMGDDIPDYEAMKYVGIPVCPADAAPEIKEISLYISDRPGGCGCVRDVVEQVLKAQGMWMNDDEAFGW